MFFYRLPLLLFLTAVMALPGNAQSRREIFSIGGNVHDAVDHQDLDNVQVTLKSPTGEIVKDTFTRGNGDFLFDGLRNGEYLLQINLKDYDLYSERVSICGIQPNGIVHRLEQIRQTQQRGGADVDLSAPAQRSAQGS